VGKGYERVAAKARQTLSRRWPDADVVVAAEPPASGILREAKRFSPDVVVMGWRGYGTFRRALIGSVSRSIVRSAGTSVLVVRRPLDRVRHIVIGVDGSPNASKAVRIAALLEPQRGASITLVAVAQLTMVPTNALAPASVKAIVRREMAALNAEAMDAAKRHVERAAAPLERAGWRVRTEVRSGAPLAHLLDVLAATKADLLMVGARATRGLDRVILGSVAEGALNLSPVPVLVAR
jgi:nucleotide-binding universal stress UspA family protein